LRLKSTQYQLINGVTFKKNYDGVLLRCLEADDDEKLLKYLHDGVVGGHFLGETITYKILRFGYYGLHFSEIPILILENVKVCQLCARKNKKHGIPLQLVTIDTPFE
jgi:hypothetical protein